MKKILVFALASASIFASCNQEENAVNTPADNNSVKVVLGTKAPVITKATIEEANWNDTQVGVYAAPKNVEITAENCFIANEKGTISNGNIAFGSDIYYPATNEVAYNFYGYHPYGTPTLANQSFTVEYTLDGTQDILWGKAVATEEQETAIGTSGFTAKYMRALSKYNAANTEATISGPSIKFEHKLTRFVFLAKDGNDEGETTSAQTIQSIQLIDVPTNVNMIIAGNGVEGLAAGTLTAEESTGNFDLKDAAGTNITDVAVSKGEYQTIGDCIMFFPEAGKTEYKIVANFVDGATSKPYSCELPIKTSNGTAFEAGTSYNVKLLVYGPGMVKLEASLTPWTDGTTDKEEHEIN